MDLNANTSFPSNKHDDYAAAQMFSSIASKDDEDIFYKSQQIGEAELSLAQKMDILEDLYQKKPTIFLERYHRFIDSRCLPLFDEANSSQKYYLDQIQAHNVGKLDPLIRNRRYLAMQELQAGGSYFSDEKMREREPYLFDLMVGQYMDDEEKLNLRPTVEIDDTNRSEFSRLLEQLDESQRVFDRRERFLDNYRQIIDHSDRSEIFMSHVDHRTLEADEEERHMENHFQMEFDSDDEEGREAERLRLISMMTGKKGKKHIAKNDETFVMRHFRDKMNKLAQKAEEEKRQRSKVVDSSSQESKAAEALSSIQISKKSPAPKEIVAQAQGEGAAEQEQREWSSGDEDELQPTGCSREQLRAEFMTMMEERFLDGKDSQFFDYRSIDSGQAKADKIQDQDMEDAYFDAEEAD